MRGIRITSSSARAFVFIGVLFIAGSAAAGEPNEKAAKPAKRLSTRLLKVLPRSTNTVMTVNLTAIRANASYLLLKKNAPRKLDALNARFERERGVPLKYVTRMTDFNNCGESSRNVLSVLQTDRAITASKTIAALKMAAQSPPSKVRFQRTSIRQWTVYSSTKLTDGRNAPWDSFCLVDDRTILSESYGHNWIKEVLTSDTPRGSKLLIQTLRSTPASDMLFVAMDLSKLSAKKKPLMRLVHGIGLLPESFGFPQQLVLRVSGRAGGKILLNIEGRNVRKLEGSVRGFIDYVVPLLKAIEGNPNVEGTPSENKVRSYYGAIRQILSKLSKSVKVKGNSVQLEANLSAEELARFMESYLETTDVKSK